MRKFTTLREEFKSECLSDDKYIEWLEDIINKNRETSSVFNITDFNIVTIEKANEIYNEIQ